MSQTLPSYPAVDRDGAHLHVVDWPGPLATSQLLLLVHGYRANLHWWDALIPWLSRYFRVVAFDFSGMGDSDTRTHYSSDCFVDDLLAVVRSLDVKPYAVIGHSWGGQIVLETCERAPEAFSHVMVLDTYLNLPSDIVPMQGIPIGNRRLHASVEEALPSFKLSPPQPLGQAILERLARQSLRQVEGGWRWKFDPDMPRLIAVPGEKLLRQVHQRVDVIYGEASSLVSTARATEMTKLLCDGRGPYVVSQAHHHMTLDQPEGLLVLLFSLLSEDLVEKRT